jgi:hypothetical protein
MASLSVAFPIQADKIEQARRWGHEKMGPRRADLTVSNRHIGLTRESWHLQQTPGGALLILSCEGSDLARAFVLYAAADGPFEQWEKQQIKELTGVDLGRPLEAQLPETLVDWQES